MSDWIDEVAEFAKTMTEVEYKIILGETDLVCERCGTCCIIPDLKYLNKSPGVKCVHLAKGNVCVIHGIKPKPCIDFPYMSRFEWVVPFKLAPPRQAIEFCKVVKKFWMEAYRHLKLRNTCSTCQVCDTCQVEV